MRKKYEKTKTLPSGIVVINHANSKNEFDNYWVISSHSGKKNILHNEGAPAIEYKDGRKYWLQYGKYHRLDGPASLHLNEEGYWINGFCIAPTKYWEHPDVKAFKYLKEHPELESFL